MNIFDCHFYYGSSLFAKTVTEPTLDKLLATYPKVQGNLIPLKPYDYLYPPANQSCLALTSNKFSQWQAVLRVDPWRESEALTLLEKSSTKTLFLHPFEEQFYPYHQSVRKILTLAQQKNMVVIIATGYLPFSHSAEVLPVVADFPNLRFVITHGGQINISGMHIAEAFEIFRRYDHTYFETSGIYRQDYIEQAITQLGSDRVLFGSGFPYYDFHFELQRIHHLNCPEPTKEKILWRNATELFL